MGAALFGYTKLYGAVPGAQAEYLRVPQAQFGPVKVSQGPPDDRFLYLSDVLLTAWQAVRYAEAGPGTSLAVLGARTDQADGLPGGPAAGRRAGRRR
jgi:threonine dehydrogenase-like Zn-dependent dehydrogenase